MDAFCLAGTAEKLAQFEANIRVCIRSDRQVAASKARKVLSGRLKEFRCAITDFGAQPNIKK